MPEPKKVNWIIVGVVSFFMVLLVGFLIWFLLHCFNVRKQEVQSLQSEIERLKAENIDNVNDTVFIKIRELSDEDSIIKLGSQYHLEVHNKNVESKDTLITDEFVIQGDILMAKREFKDSIGRLSYMVDGKVVAKRDLLIKK